MLGEAKQGFAAGVDDESPRGTPGRHYGIDHAVTEG